MDNLDTSHCRLCAAIKPIEKLVNLESDKIKRGDIVNKLNRLNTDATHFFEGDILPKTVCLICIGSLDRAFEFVENVNHAQELLNNIYKKVKKEEYLSDDANADLPPDPPPDLPPPVKEEPEEHIPVKKAVKKQTNVVKSKLTWKDYKWTCAKCDTEFATIDELKSHSMTYHECCNAFKCTDCNKKMLRLDKFILHVKRHRKYLKLSCYICHSKFSSARKVSTHKKVHMDSEHICSGCNTTFPRTEALRQHIKQYYKSVSGSSVTIIDTSDSLTCVLCNKTFKNKGSLDGHLLIHSQRIPYKKRAHICDRCGKSYFNKCDLVAHVVSHEDARPFQCEICKSDFKSMVRLKAHMKVHNDIKPHSCPQCGRSFRLRKQLRSHEIIHTDSLPFVCPHCSKAFRFKNILDLHLRQHTGVKPYCCELCQRNFTNWSNYNKHMKRRHGTSMSKKKLIVTVESNPVNGIVQNLPPMPDKALHLV